MEEHDDGRIIVDGTELTTNIQEIRKETGMVFQNFNFFPRLSIISDVAIGLRQVRRMPKSEAEALAMELLTRVKIPEMGFAREVADRVVFMAEGEIVQVGTPKDIFDNPQEERTKQFFSQII